MPLPAPDPVAAALAAAEQHYDQGRLDEALVAARQASELCAAAPGHAQAPAAARLRCLAAFRVGEIAESAQAGIAFFEASAPPGGVAASDAQRLDVACVSVVAAGETLRFDQMLAHLRIALQVAQRMGTLADWVRARGTAAAAFTLLGDPWAAQRLAAELAGTFQGLADQPRLETTARGNHCATSLVLARMARDAGDAVRAGEALAHAEASLARMRELVALTRDARGAAFADVHEAELALAQGGAARALSLLRGSGAPGSPPAKAPGEAASVGSAALARGLRGHARWLALLEGEALVAVGHPAQAQQLLAPLQHALGADSGQDFAMRVQLHSVLHRASLALHEHAAARTHLEAVQALERQLRYRQLQAQSAHLRERLELEHMYRYRAARPR